MRKTLLVLAIVGGLLAANVAPALAVRVSAPPAATPGVSPVPVSGSAVGTSRELPSNTGTAVADGSAAPVIVP